MLKRSLSILLGAGLAGALMVAAPPSARAADEPVTCPITGTSPAVVVLGIAPQRVQFGVQTECDGQYPVSWAMVSDIFPGSSGASWLMLRNYDYPYGEKFTYVEDPQGYFPVNFIGGGPFQGNTMVGTHPLWVGAFYDVDADGVMDGDEPMTEYRGSFIAKQATTFGDSFKATTDRRGHKRHHQSVTFTATLQSANWDLGGYENHAAQVALQFRPSGARHYRTVKQVSDDGTGASVSVKITQTGLWRFRYSGDDGTGATNTAGIKIKATRH